MKKFLNFFKMLGQIFMAIGDAIFPVFAETECSRCGSTQPKNTMEGGYCMDCFIKIMK